MREKDDLDLLLDSALLTYADPGPDACLEDRVLNALTAGSAPEVRTTWAVRKPRRTWLRWAIALPIAGCLLLLWLSTPKTIHAPSTRHQEARQNNPAAALSPAVTAEISTHTPRRLVTRAIQSAPPPSNAQVANDVPRPKLDVFPTPQPMSAEERALSLVAAQTPLPLRKALVDAQQDDPPIHIASTHIPPLDSPDQGQP
ncbi:MAG TPA: hypothetical protein VGG85_04625 [Terracidiphilus sp.]|jgi:hypothetical protein